MSVVWTTNIFQWHPLNSTVLVQFSWATSDLWLIQQNKFYWISHRSMVAQLNCTVTNSTRPKNLKPFPFRFVNATQKICSPEMGNIGTCWLSPKPFDLHSFFTAIHRRLLGLPAVSPWLVNISKIATTANLRSRQVPIARDVPICPYTFLTARCYHGRRLITSNRSTLIWQTDSADETNWSYQWQKQSA